MMIGATPATFTNSGCTTPSAMPAATPASIALPPASRILKPASAARYWVAAIMWCVPMMVGRWDFMPAPGSLVRLDAMKAQACPGSDARSTSRAFSGNGARRTVARGGLLRGTVTAIAPRGYSPRGQVDVAHRPDDHGRHEPCTGEHARHDGRGQQNRSQRIRDPVECPSNHADEAGEEQIERIEEDQEHDDKHDDLQDRSASQVRAEKPRYLADAPQAPEHEHVDEPTETLLEPRTELPDQVLHPQLLQIGRASCRERE